MTNLSPREIEVMELVVDGASYKDIGEKLFISPGTVKSHLARISEKLGAKNRTHAAVIYVRLENK